MLERQTIGLFGWHCLSIFLGDWGFFWRGFNSWIDFFSYSLIFGINIGSLLVSNPKIIHFIDDSRRNQHSRLTKQSQIISYCFKTFWLVTQLNAMIFVCWKSITSMYQILIGHRIKRRHKGLFKDTTSRLVREYLFSLHQNKYQTSDHVTSAGGQVMSWFKLDQCTDKTQRLLTICFDSL